MKMSEAKFTKGPWVVFERFGNKQVDNDDLDLHICSFQGRGDNYDYDAHLIAAAPILFDELFKLDPENKAIKLALGLK